MIITIICIGVDSGGYLYSTAIGDLALLQAIPVATMQEVLEFIEVNKLYGTGYIDLALLGSVFLSKNQSLWTHDKRLNMLALEHGKAFQITT